MTEDYLMLSGIQHFQFCRRQWALIHIENQWLDNVKTVEGQIIHEKADQPDVREKRGEKVIVRALPVHSHSLKTSGVCDVVEFIKDDKGVYISREKERFLPFPIEYKRGKPKSGTEDIVQLVAQAICLEEMFLIEINQGAFFYDEIKKRVPISITKEMKQKVSDLFSEMWGYYQRQYTPKVKSGKHCKNCSLNTICLPNTMQQESVKMYMERFLE